MTLDEIREFQEVVVTAVCEYGAELADVLLPEAGSGGIREDPFTQLGVLLRAYRSLDLVGSPWKPLDWGQGYRPGSTHDYFDKFTPNRDDEPEVRAAMRTVVEAWVDGCERDEDFAEHLAAARRALAVVDEIDRVVEG